MDNISKLNKNDCTGCRMCEQICPTKAIKMIENSEGFIEPKVDKEKCINCGLCISRCPQLNNIENKEERKEAYAAKNLDLEEQKQSSSGGIFSVIANYVIENNGIVFGCAFNENLVAEHIGIDSKKELYKLRGSKYVQSNTKHTFTETRENLEKGRLVLYSGTPCQIAGLKSFLGKEYENLITVDLVCHGVPSPKLFKKYKEWLENKYGSKIVRYEFRNKEKREMNKSIKISFKNKKNRFFFSNLDPYNKSFYNNLTLREVCYKCKYAKMDRISDFTLGDYWGIEKQYPKFEDKNGVSLILINTNKGKKIFEKIKNKISKIDTGISSAVKENRNLKEASKRSDIRNNVYKNNVCCDFYLYSKKYLKFKKNWKDIIKNSIPYSIKNIIRNWRLQ